MADRLRSYAKRVVPSVLHRRFRWIDPAVHRLALEQKVWRDRLRPSRRRSHGLPGQLIVSLTSHPARFATLHRTLSALLRQSVQPDRLILWIGEGTVAPLKVVRLVSRGLEIRPVRDQGSFTKLLPALAVFPQAFIVTADDDVYYPPDWLEGLIEDHDAKAPTILCRRTHRLGLGEDGALRPYAEWQKDVRDGPARAPSIDLIPTGVGGVLYPPGLLDPRILDEALFAGLCPHNDDFWFYWMARLAGSKHRQVGAGFAYREWPGSQAVTLHSANLAGRYDKEIAALEQHFGLPGSTGGLTCQPHRAMA